MKMFLNVNFKLKVNETLVLKLKGKRIFKKSLLFSYQTGIKVHANPGLA